MKKSDNFDANKWLVENKITTQSRLNENQVPNINFDKLNQILKQASEVTNSTGKKLLNGDINKFLKFIQLAITSLENQDADWGDKVTGTPLLYMLLSSRYTGKDKDKWEDFNEVMEKFSEASYESEHGTIPKKIIDELREALTELQQYIDLF